VESFKRGIAAASASCFVTEQTAHFDISIMEWISERIQVREVKTTSDTPLNNSNNNNNNNNESTKIKTTTTTTTAAALDVPTMTMPVPVVKQS
jgi:hypothetical protein